MAVSLDGLGTEYLSHWADNQITLRIPDEVSLFGLLYHLFHGHLQDFARLRPAVLLIAILFDYLDIGQYVFVRVGDNTGLQAGLEILRLFAGALLIRDFSLLVRELNGLGVSAFTWDDIGNNAF